MVQETEVKLNKREATDRLENLQKEIMTMEWDIEHHGLKLKQGLYDKKKSEIEAIKKFLTT
ncbi:MAG: hypothetical protein KKA79_07760 [Nanoarchaeota archaeon]|nr:hypothetical protein [Nanoarchaeota archaeon]MCG2718848.1 hypothetical protein [Nanoarchaeota archaeon]